MDNVAFLTSGNEVYSKKRAKKRGGLEELTFNPDERKNYLTGFHKRKAERQKKAAEHAKEQARKEKVEARKEIREARKADLEKRLKAAGATAEESDREGDSTGQEDVPEDKNPQDSIWESHFEDAEKLTTVTVVEDFDQMGLENADMIPKPEPVQAIVPPTKQKRNATHDDKKKKKKKSFRYGTKAERQSDLIKAKLKSIEKPRKPTSKPRQKHAKS